MGAAKSILGSIPIIGPIIAAATGGSIHHQKAIADTLGEFPALHQAAVAVKGGDVNAAHDIKAWIAQNPAFAQALLQKIRPGLISPENGKVSNYPELIPLLKNIPAHLSGGVVGFNNPNDPRKHIYPGTFGHGTKKRAIRS